MLRFTAYFPHLIDKSVDEFSNNLSITHNRICHVKDVKKGHINSCEKAANLKTRSVIFNEKTESNCDTVEFFHFYEFLSCH